MTKDSSKLHKMIDDFFDQHLASGSFSVGNASASSNAGVSFLQDAPQKVVSRDHMCEIEAVGTFEALRRYWQSNGVSFDGAMIDDLKSIHEALEELAASSQDEDGDVSSFIYAMY